MYIFRPLGLQKGTNYPGGTGHTVLSGTNCCPHTFRAGPSPAGTTVSNVLELTLHERVKKLCKYLNQQIHSKAIIIILAIPRQQYTIQPGAVSN